MEEGPPVEEERVEDEEAHLGCQMTVVKSDWSNDRGQITSFDQTTGQMMSVEDEETHLAPRLVKRCRMMSFDWSNDVK